MNREPDFSEEETKRLLAGVDPSTLPPTLVEKLKRRDLLELYEVLPRNLIACLERDS